MKILVLGGTRFVGLRLVRLLAETGHDITILNRGRTPAELPPGIKRLYADRRNPAEMLAALKGHDFDAAYDITGYQVVNIEAAVAALTGRVGHYIFQSTCGVYAPRETIPVSEDFPLVDSSNAPADEAAYVLEKVACERYLLRTHAESGLPVTIFRSPVIYGPENWMDDREGSYFFRILQGRRILVPGNGAALRHFVHVDDVARAYLAATGREVTLGQVYNVAAARAITINGYMDAIARAVGTPARKVYIEPHVARSLKRPLFPFAWEHSSYYDTCKARTDFGYRPLFDIEEGMEHTYRWWRDKRGVAGVRFVPGKLGHDVDLEFEDEVLAKYG